MGKSKKGQRAKTSNAEREGQENLKGWINAVDDADVVANELDALSYLLAMSGPLDTPSSDVVCGLCELVSSGAETIRKLSDIIMEDHHRMAAGTM